jgi:hypothetical protein
MAASNSAAGAPPTGHRAAPEFLATGRPMLNSRSVRRLERPNSAECDREKLVPCDETLIKQLEAAIQAQDKREKALDVLLKRIASGKVSDNMLLRIVLSLSKSTACVAVDRRPRRRS